MVVVFMPDFNGHNHLARQDYIKKMEQERFESDLQEAHQVLAHMGSRLHTLEQSTAEAGVARVGEAPVVAWRATDSEFW